MREFPYREFSGVDAVEVVVAHGADVDRAAELPDEQPLVELLVEEGVDLKDIKFQLRFKFGGSYKMSKQGSANPQTPGSVKMR